MCVAAGNPGHHAFQAWWPDDPMPGCLLYITSLASLRSKTGFGTYPAWGLLGTIGAHQSLLVPRLLGGALGSIGIHPPKDFYRGRYH